MVNMVFAFSARADIERERKTKKNFRQVCDRLIEKADQRGAASATVIIERGKYEISIRKL